ncbi:MAG: hypothetical protein ABIL02_06515 [candidate division WOR-3 bacterium]
MLLIGISSHYLPTYYNFTRIFSRSITNSRFLCQNGYIFLTEARLSYEFR